MLHSGGDTNLLLVTGGALTEQGLALAQQIAGKTGCKVMGQTYHPRMARGRGRFSIDRIPYVIESALPILKNFKNIVLVEARDPVAFFAYPNKPSMLKPEGCEVHQMTVMGRELGRGAGSAGGCARRQARRRQAAEARRAHQADRRAQPRLDRAGDCAGDPRERDHRRRIHHHRPRLLPADGGGRAA